MKDKFRKEIHQIIEKHLDGLLTTDPNTNEAEDRYVNMIDEVDKCSWKYYKMNKQKQEEESKAPTLFDEISI